MEVFKHLIGRKVSCTSDDGSSGIYEILGCVSQDHKTVRMQEVYALCVPEGGGQATWCALSYLRFRQEVKEYSQADNTDMAPMMLS